MLKTSVGILVLVVLLFSGTASWAQVGARERYPNSETELSKNQRQAVQAQMRALGWYKNGPVDGNFGEPMREAIKRMQKSMRREPTGLLTSFELSMIMSKDEYAEELVRLEGTGKAPPLDATLLSRERCPEIKATGAAVGAGTSVKLSRSALRVGEAVQLAITGKAPTKRLPLFLIVSLDRPARFAGKGFYVLSPEARAPFGIATASDKTRLVVPLYVEGTALDRQIDVRPVFAGDMTVAVSIVAATACGEQASPVLAAARIDVAPGRPEIVVSETVRLAKPGKVITSPSGDRLIEVLGDNSFRLIEKTTGQQILSQAGQRPRFSPTGRFLTAVRDGGLEIWDALDGAPVGGSSSARDIAWDNKDSFVIVSENGQGTVSVLSPFITKSNLGDASLGCRPCGGLDSTAVKIDLENNFILAAARGRPNERAAHSLTENRSFQGGGQWPDTKAILKYGSADRFVAETSRLVEVKFPADWEFIDKPRYTEVNLHLLNPTVQPEDKLRSGIVANHFVKVLLQSEAAGIPDNAIPTARLARGVTAVAPGFDSQKRSFDIRTQEFGIPDHPTVELERVRDALVQTGAAKNFANVKVPISSYRHDSKIVIDTSQPCNLDAVKPDDKGRLKISARQATFWRVKAKSRVITLLGAGCEGGSMGVAYGAAGYFDSKKPGRLRYINSGIPYYQAANPGRSCEGATCDYHVALSHDRYLLVWSSFFSAIEIIDLEKGVTLAYAAYRGDAIQRVSLSSDARLLVQRNRDGTFAVHDVRKGSKVTEEPTIRYAPPTTETAILFGRYADDEIVVWTKSGYFDATYEGSAQVSLRFSGFTELFALDQFASLVRRPGLAEQVFAGKFADKEIAFRIPPTIIATAKAEAARVSISAQQTSGAPIQKFVVYQDGLRTNVFTAEASKPQQLLQFERQPGVRWVSVVGIDGSGLATRPWVTDLGPASSKRRLRVLGIGVDVYTDAALPTLKYARSDVDRLIKAMGTSPSRVYAAAEVMTLHDQAATRTEALSGLGKLLASSGPDADVMLIFAGHGLKGSDGQYYLALSNTDTNDLAGTALAWREISALIQRSAARVTIVLDSCHSGEAGRGMFATNDDMARSVLEGTAGNVVIFSGSKGREYSEEAEVAGGGNFTAALVETLSEASGSADANRNGVLEASELYSAVKQAVVTQTKGRQTPWIARNSMIGDFAFW